MSLAYQIASALAILAFLPFDGFAASKDMPTPPPLGKLVDVGGYRVHLYCIGEGSPTVIVTGTEFSFDWALVQPEVAKFVRICTYDASGTAWSDPGPTLTCQARVAEIHNVLQKALIEPPYVLVGLSMGAIVARLYANQYSTETAGMVFVDHAFLDVGPSDSGPALDGEAPVFPPIPQRLTSRETVPISSVDERPVLLHKEPISATIEDNPSFAKLPEFNRKLHQWAVSLHPTVPTVKAAEECLSVVNAATATKTSPLGEMPLAVISTVNHPANYAKLQTTLLLLSSDSKQFLASQSFHAVTIEQPEIIVVAIREVTDAIKQHKRLK